MDYFFSQTMLDISPDNFTFESKNELLKTDLVVTIPKRLYEQVKIQLLNGNLKYDDTAAEDAIIKHVTVIFAHQELVVNF